MTAATGKLEVSLHTNTVRLTGYANPVRAVRAYLEYLEAHIDPHSFDATEALVSAGRDDMADIYVISTATDLQPLLLIGGFNVVMRGGLLVAVLEAKALPESAPA